MVIGKRAREHLCVHVTAQAELEADLALGNDLAEGVWDVDHVADASRLVGEEGEQLGGGVAGDLGKVDCDGESELSRELEGGCEECGVAYRGVAALVG